jgi:hypothetical protein
MKMKNNANLIGVAVLFLAIGFIAGFLITSGASKTGDAVRGISGSYETENIKKDTSMTVNAPFIDDSKLISNWKCHSNTWAGNCEGNPCPSTQYCTTFVGSTGVRSCCVLKTQVATD